MASVVATLARFALTRLYPFPRGQGRIVDRTFLSKIRFPEETLTVRTLEGVEMTVMPNDLIGRHLFLTGQFDRTNIEVLSKYARPGDTMLDIGANVGYVSCAMLAIVPRLRVVAVEPQAKCYDLLQRNLSRFGDRGSCEKVAISDESGEGVMDVQTSNSGASSLSDGVAESTGERVSVITAGQLLERHRLERIDLVKIDVEGHEARVIASLAPILEERRPRAILFEHHGGKLAKTHPIRATLAGLDYRILGIHKRLRTFDLIDLDTLPEQHGYWFNDLVAVSSRD